ncbi:MAG TPA: hypothetical protein VG900_06490 [Hyphomicrobiaceae bacterium]|jgi:hypothetical protein|nr:hypothetical protein [Hyphomicrobiaceae bacterium]
MLRLFLRLLDGTFITTLALVLVSLASAFEAAFAGANSIRPSTAPAPLIGLGLPAAAGAAAVVFYIRRFLQKD